MSLRAPTSADLDGFWLRLDDAAPLVLVRTAYGLVTLAWAVTLVPDFDLIFAPDGLNRTPGFHRWRLLSVFRYSDNEAVLAAGLGALLVCSALVVAGRGLRVSLPIAVVLQVSLAQHAAAWSIGAESVLRVIGVYLAIFALVTPVALQGRRPASGHASARAPVWPLRLIQLQVLLVYLTTALEKLRGHEWRDGSAVFHALEIEHIRRFSAPAFITDTELIVKTLTYGTLAIEFALPVLLLWPRTRRWSVLLAIGLHLSFEAFLELGFFGPAMIVGILAFVSPRDASRLLRWGRADTAPQRVELITPVSNPAR